MEITLNDGIKYQFIWCGMKMQREAGVGLLIKIDPKVIIKDAEIMDPRMIVINIKAYGFNKSG